MSRVVVNEIEAKVGNDITFNDTVKISTAQIDTVRGKTTAGSVTVQGEGTNTTNLQQGLCKAWVNLNGTGTIATRDTFNIASTVDNGTGNYDAVFTSSMNDANYSVTGTVADNIPISSNRDSIFQCVAESASQINLNAFSSSQQDRTHFYGQVFGDLA